MTDYLILANGEPTGREQELLLNKHLLALDGGADHLLTLGLLPQTILGDFDSIQSGAHWGLQATYPNLVENTPPYQGHHGVTIVPAKDQAHTDLDKGILYCDAHQASSITILNATGGRLDHTLMNLRLLHRHYHPNRSLTLITATETVQPLHNETIELPILAQTPCAILAFPSATLTTSGLTYESTDRSLVFGHVESTSNHALIDYPTLTVQGEALVIYQN